MIIDIDGTIADNSHRAHFLESDYKDWNSFYSHCLDDSPITPVLDVITSLSLMGVKALFVTGRPESIASLTKDWLTTYLFSVTTDTAKYFFRKDGDFRLDFELKRSIYIESLSNLGVTPDNTIVFDDRGEVVNMWRSLGFKCFQVANSTY